MKKSKLISTLFTTALALVAGFQLSTARAANPGLGEHWHGPYLQKAVPHDPWGHPYIYHSPGEKDDYDLMSYGKDGAPGGQGESADITNH